jgi:similar to spore coat protein
MGILDMLMGINNPLGDREIASDMLKDSKFAVISLGKTVTEITNPQLKALMVNHLLTAINQHHQLSDLLIERDWYKPFLNPMQQVSDEILMANNLKS